MRTGSGSRVFSASPKLYQILLVAYPAEHRREYGPLMAQLFRDLCRDTYQRSGLLGLVGVWIPTLWDLVKTAASEHIDVLRKGSLPQMQNHPLIPVSWLRVGLAILPGLLVIGTRSGFFEDMLGRRISQVLEPNGLLVLCALLIVTGLVLGRKLVAWSFPALGILLFGVWWLVPPVAAFGVYQVYKQKGLRIPRSGKIILCLLGLVFAADFILSVLSDHNPEKLAAIVAGLSPLLLWIGLLLLPIAIGLPLAQREGLLAGLFIVAAEFILFFEIFDPSYALGMWTSNQALIVAAEVVPAVGFLVVVPIWIMRSRSTHGRIWGLLLPVFAALIGTEAISGTVRPYYTGIWLTRAIGIAQFLATLALAVVLYVMNRQDGSPTPNQEALVH